MSASEPLTQVSLDPNDDPTVYPENKTTTSEHCFYAFDVLYCELTGEDPVDPDFADGKYPLFVTWNKHSRSGDMHLRGCIGTFEAQPLQEGLAEYALISALKDSRFSPIRQSELPYLQCAISLLTDFEDASSYLDWTVGVHGIYISFANPTTSGALSGGDSSSGTPTPDSSSPSLNLNVFTKFARRPMTATYLPEVMPDQGWDKVEAVDNAIRKAGWTGRITEDLRRSIKLRRYQSSKCAVRWDEFVAWRKAQGQDISSEMKSTGHGLINTMY